MTTPLSTDSFAGRNVTLVGLGRFGGGAAVVRFLLKHNAIVTVTDRRSELQLADSIAEFEGQPIRWFLSQHPDEAFDGCDLAVMSPAIAPHSDLHPRLADRGIPTTSEIELFTANNWSKTIAVTGSNGKSTTTTLIADILRRHFEVSNTATPTRVFAGGNIGRSLLDDLDEITSADWCVLELSSFQLWQLRKNPFRADVAVLTNFTPNHLDWHGTLSEYRRAKEILFRRLPSTATAVLPGTIENLGDSRLTTHTQWTTPARVLRFAATDTGESSSFWDGDSLVIVTPSGEDAARCALPTGLPGDHSRLNVAAAAAACSAAAAVTAETIVSAVSQFRPLPHRLELVASGHERQFFDDSVSTTPESTAAAISVFRQPVVLLLGGADKGIELDGLLAAAAKAKAVVLLGRVGQRIAEEMAARNKPGETLLRQWALADSPEDAFTAAVAFSEPGDIVLLSPGCASTDWFADYRDRGRQFADFVRKWTPGEL